MHYYLKINDTVLPNVSELQITEAYRNETVTYSLGGTMTVERLGKAKISIKAKVNAITPEIMTALKDAVQLSVNTTVYFYQGDKLRVRKMRISPFTEPSPLYRWDDRTKGYIYGSVELEMEDV